MPREIEEPESYPQISINRELTFLQETRFDYV